MWKFVDDYSLKFGGHGPTLQAISRLSKWWISGVVHEAGLRTLLAATQDELLYSDGGPRTRLITQWRRAASSAIHRVKVKGTPASSLVAGSCIVVGPAKVEVRDEWSIASGILYD